MVDGEERAISMAIALGLEATLIKGNILKHVGDNETALINMDYYGWSDEISDEPDENDTIDFEELHDVENDVLWNNLLEKDTGLQTEVATTIAEIAVGGIF